MTFYATVTSLRTFGGTKFLKFCIVGGSGTIVDMVLLFLLADHGMLGLNITISKVVAAEIALLNNFTWNEFWTFKKDEELSLRTSAIRRFFVFNAVCGMGILFNVALLHLFHSWIGWNLYLSNLSAIAIVTLWNFGMNARFNWHAKPPALNSKT